jgi:hypothetical protein
MHRSLALLLLGSAVLGGGSAEGFDTASRFNQKAALYEGTTVADAALELESRLGVPVAALEIAVEPRWLTVKIENPSLPGHVEQYRYDGKTWSGPVVVTIEDVSDLAANLFPLRDVNFASIPGLVKGAGQRVEILDGEVAHVSIRRQLPFSHDVRISVSVRGAERAGLLWSDAQGNVLEARAL